MATHGVCDPTECKSKCCHTQGRCGTEEECNPVSYLGEARTRLGESPLKWVLYGSIILLAVLLLLLLRRIAA